MFREGKLCGRCLRGCDTRTHDELSIMLDAEEDDDLSIAESYLNDSRCDSDTLVQVSAGFIFIIYIDTYPFLKEKKINKYCYLWALIWCMKSFINVQLLCVMLVVFNSSNTNLPFSFIHSFIYFIYFFFCFIVSIYFVFFSLP